MTAGYLPPIGFLRECFDLDLATGTIRWRVRPDHHFASPAFAASWNTKWAGKPALTRIDRDGYALGEVVFDGKRLRLRAHRVALKLATGQEPETVDHIDGDKANNRPENLRAASITDNRRNCSGWARHPLPKGVSFEKGRFRARARRGGKKVDLGSFRTPGEAHAAHCAFVREVDGEFFRAGPAKVTVFD